MTYSPGAVAAATRNSVAKGSRPLFAGGSKRQVNCVRNIYAAGLRVWELISLTIHDIVAPASSSTPVLHDLGRLVWRKPRSLSTSPRRRPPGMLGTTAKQRQRGADAVP